MVTSSTTGDTAREEALETVDTGERVPGGMEEWGMGTWQQKIILKV